MGVSSGETGLTCSGSSAFSTAAFLFFRNTAIAWILRVRGHMKNRTANSTEKYSRVNCRKLIRSELIVAERGRPSSAPAKLVETALPAMQISATVRIAFKCFCIRIKFSVHFILQKYNETIAKNEMHNTIFIRKCVFL